MVPNRATHYISDKIDVIPLETLKKLNVFWELYIAINQVCHEYQWAGISMIVGVLDVLITTFNDFFRLIRLYITRFQCRKYGNIGEV